VSFKDPAKQGDYQHEYARARRAPAGVCQTPGQTPLPAEFRLKTARDVLDLLAEETGRIEVLERMKRFCRPLLSEAAAEVGSPLLAAFEPSQPDGDGGGSEELPAALTDPGQWWRVMDDAVDRHLPTTDWMLRRKCDWHIAAIVGTVRTVLEGFGRFTVPLLGMDGLAVVGAWVPYLAERLGRLDLTLGEVDEAEAVRVEASARRFWGRVVG
jgi:hypothetical protein